MVKSRRMRWTGYAARKTEKEYLQYIRYGWESHEEREH
jgi:uncharacterized protein YfbU (UPF0304 family)